MTRGDVVLALLGLASIAAVAARNALRRANERLERDLGHLAAMHEKTKEGRGA